MSTGLPKIDPYAVLGVDKDADLSQIRTAHRKLVLKCHPDKIKDEALQNKARDEFQRVQEAYELLSDESRRSYYDAEVRLAALRKETADRRAAKGESYSSSKGASSREFRDGRLYEERTPAGVYEERVPTGVYFDDSDEPRFSEEPRSHSRRYDDYGRRSHTKSSEEKKPKSAPQVPPRTTKESSTREYVKVSHHDRAKHRTKERRREFSDKYERTTGYVDSDYSDDFSDDSDIEPVYLNVRSGHKHSGSRESRESKESRRSREPLPRRSKTEPGPARKPESRRHHRDREPDDSDDWEKFDNLQSSVKDYIHRSKLDPPVEVDRRQRGSHSPQGHGDYESSDRHERERASRHSARHTRTESVRNPAASPPRSHRRSHERLESSPTRGYERKAPSMPIPSLPTGTSSPKVSSSTRPPAPPVRSSTAPHPRSRREGSASNVLKTVADMVSGVSNPPPRTKLRSTDRNDSGYSSPSTPEMPQSSSNAPKVNRFKIVDPPETVVVEPADAHRYHRSTSPLRTERPVGTSRVSSKSTRAPATYTYPVEEMRHEVRPATTTRTSSSRLFGEVRYAPPIRTEHIQYAYPRDSSSRYARRESMPTR